MSADDVAFLVRSPNRAAVLSELAAQPQSRAALREAVEASRITVGRITTDLAERGWIAQTAEGYRATTAGKTVAAAYEQFVGTVETTRKLDPLIEYLPVEAFDFGLGALADAELVAPVPADPGKHFTRLARAYQEASEASMMAHAVSTDVVASTESAVLSGDHATEGIVTTAVVDAIREDEAVRTRVVRMLDHGGLALAERPSVPLQVGVFDEETFISADDEAGIPKGIVVTESPTVRAWFREDFERYRDTATPLTAADFAVD